MPRCFTRQLRITWLIKTLYDVSLYHLICSSKFTLAMEREDVTIGMEYFPVHSSHLQGDTVQPSQRETVEYVE
jgi:hypothetical protein